jgi:uncharacterized protein (TIGR00661 family)
MKNINVGIFISDDGFGHTVRQASVIQELLLNKINVTVITKNKIQRLKDKFKKKISYIKIHNLIESKKKYDGSLCKKSTLKVFESWNLKKKSWQKKVNKFIKNFDLVISDSVPQVYELTKLNNIPSINISHYTWDWLYKKLYKNKKKHILRNLSSLYLKCDFFLFPPLTNAEIIEKYKRKVNKINFILSDTFCKKKLKKNFFLKCLIMDNGSKVMSKKIENIIPFLDKIPNVFFYVSCNTLKRDSIKLLNKKNNCKAIFGLREVHEYMSLCDFLIARGGFNTISESINLKIPALLCYEKNNPEVINNINSLYFKNYCSIIKANDFNQNIIKRIDKFLMQEFKPLKNSINSYRSFSSGPKDIVNFIKKLLSNQN